MAEEFFIPKLGQTVEEVTLMDWLVPDGAKVEAGQAILEVETDKAVFPVDANAGGYLHVGPHQKGDVVPVLTVVGVTESYENTSFINEVMVEVNDLAFDWLDAPMVRVASANVPVPRAEVLEDIAIPNVGRIVEACRKVVR